MKSNWFRLFTEDNSANILKLEGDLLSDENNEKRIYKLLITKGNDPDDQYGFYKERIDSQNDFSYIEYNTEDDDLTDDIFNEIDVTVLLFGLYHNNQELFDELINKSREFLVEERRVTSSFSHFINSLDQCVPDFSKRSGISTPLLCSKCFTRDL